MCLLKFGIDPVDPFQHLWIHRHGVKYGRHAVHADGLDDVDTCDLRMLLCLRVVCGDTTKGSCSQTFSRLAFAVLFGLLIIYGMGSSPKPESVEFH